MLQRADSNLWQFVSGGGEGDETPLEAASREAYEEAGIDLGYSLQPLDSLASIPRAAFADIAHWPKSLYVIPEYAFAVNIGDKQLGLSCEHVQVRWCNYANAHSLLHWDSNRTALWELNERLTTPMPLKEK